MAVTMNAQDAVYHSHDFYEIFYVLEGDITHIINKKEETLTMGDMLFISPKDFHGFIRKPNQLTSKHRDIVINKSYGNKGRGIYLDDGAYNTKVEGNLVYGYSLGIYARTVTKTSTDSAWSDSTVFEFLNTNNKFVDNF